jgi:hypothetical protein
MPSGPSLARMSHRSKQSPSGAPEACFPIDESLATALYTQYYSTKFFLYMPVDIIESVLIEWTKLVWFAPTIARQVCRYLKEITDKSPRVWSKLFLQETSRMTSNDVREWLIRAKAAPKEIVLEAKSIRVAIAALKGAKDATSLIYRIPNFDDILPFQLEQIRLPTRMPLLHHLCLHTLKPRGPMSLTYFFGLSESPEDAHFPCLTVLHLVSIDLTDFPNLPGQFPVLRCLVISGFRGSCLNLIRACSESLEDLTVSWDVSWLSSPPSSPQSSPQSPSQSLLDDHIFLPNLRVLHVEYAPGVVSELEAPTLRLIYADLDGIEINGPTRTFSSVVEWATRRSAGLPPTDITSYLIHMPELRHLMLFQSMETLKLCFEFLRDNPAICPNLQSIEVVNLAQYPDFELDDNFMEFLRGCITGRTESVPGFVIEVIEERDQAARFERHYAINVRLFIVIRHYFAYHASRIALARSTAQ